jgi:hypothetical protein
VESGGIRKFDIYVLVIKFLSAYAYPTLYISLLLLNSLAERIWSPNVHLLQAKEILSRSIIIKINVSVQQSRQSSQISNL